MWRLPLFFALLHVVHGSCPYGYDLVADGECRGFVASMTVSFDQATNKAIAKCNETQAKAVIIHNEEQQTYWKGKAPQTTDGFLILGLVCNFETKKWVWADGSSLNYRPATNLYNPELDKPCTQGYSWDIHPDGYWSYGGPGSYINAVIYCTTQLGETPTIDDTCEDKVCYQVSAATATWQDGQKICRNYGGNLASIHSSKANSFVRKLAVSSGAVSGAFVGASTTGDALDRWIKYGLRAGSMDQIWTTYAPGFPMKNFGNCVAMDTSTAAGNWMNVDCNFKLPVVCARKETSTFTPTCDGEPPKEGNMFTSPGFPNSASTPCEFFLSAPAGKKVELNIILMEANSCCDSLVLYDGYMGGSVIGTLTGQMENFTVKTKTSNVMRVSWQPKSGLNVKGVAMTFRAV